MPKADEILLQLKAENKQLKAKLKDSAKSVNKFSKGIGKVSAGFKSLLTGAGIFTVIRGFQKLIEITDKQQKAEAQLNAVLKSTQQAAGLTAKEVKKMARELQAVTTFGDETILTAQNMLLTFTKIGKDVFPAATETVLNMAQAMGTDLKTQAIQVGKALNDPILGVTALRRVGVQLSEQQEDSIKQFVKVNDIAGAQKIILGELETQFGGVARAASKTLGGAFQQLGNRLGDMVEDLGSELTPELTRVSTALFQTAGDAKNLGRQIGKIIVLMIRLAEVAASTFNILKRVNPFTALAQGAKDLFAGKSPVAAMAEEFTKLRGKAESVLELIKNLDKTNEDSVETARKHNKILTERNKIRNKEKKEKEDKKDPRVQEIELLKFLGEQELAEQKALDLKREQLEKAHGDKKNEIRAAADLKRREIENKFLQFQIQNGLKILGATGNMLSQLGALVSMASSNRLSNLDAEQEARREEIENTIVDEEERAEALAVLDEEFQRKKLREQRKAAKIQKKIAIAETLISIPQAAFAAFKSLAGIPIVGPALGAAAAAAATLLGLKKLQLIKDAPLPVLQKGRVPNAPSDHFPAMIGSNEAVINGRSTRNNLELLDMINRNPEVTFSPIITTPDRPQQTVVNIGGRTFFDEISRGIDDGQIRVNSRGVVGG